jgi:histidine triad (HIT) family protein
MKVPGCVFCDLNKIASKVEWENGADGSAFMVFEPLQPCTPGHLLVVPEQHVSDATEDRYVAAMAMSVASRVASMHRASNIITSVGRPATQSIFHLHLHVVPRQYGDGLMLPWSEPPKPLSRRAW